MDMCAPKVSWHAVICGFLIINRKKSTSERRQQTGSGSLCVCFEYILWQAEGTPPSFWPYQKSPVQAPMCAEKATNTTG